jgi:GntR family transcriptional regulator
VKCLDRFCLDRFCLDRLQDGCYIPSVTIPTYLKMADELEAEISSMDVNTRLASEKDLAVLHGVNRLTARAAVQELERRYLVRRRPGSGTFVAERVEFRITPTSPPSWSEVIRRSGATPRTETLSMRTVRTLPWLRDALHLSSNDRVVHLRRIRYVNEEPACIADTYLAADLVPDLRIHLKAHESLHRVLSEDYRLDPFRAELKMDVEVAPSDVAHLLGLGNRPMMFHVVARSDSRRLKRPLQMTTTWNRPDILRVVIDLSENS